MEQRIKPKRVLLKLSGEILMGEKPFGIEAESCEKLAVAIKMMKQQGMETALVIGGGNIFRGVRLKEIGIEQTPADHMGMLSTMMNGIALERALVAQGTKAKVLSAVPCPPIVEQYEWRKALDLLSQGTTLIFVGGTGNPYFTTDSAAALRASEIQADLLLKATKVDGIYTKDPIKHPDAKRFETITYGQILADKLEVMDATAIALCRSSRIPIFVFNMAKLFSQPFETILQEKNGTLVSGD
ncbi:UMP kinase [Estrella lausannensis]|nr:UMP kinase [Estrella lausannensis]